MPRDARGRTLSFSLASLFGLMSIAAIASAWYGNYRRALVAQEQAISAIAMKGGQVVIYRQEVRVVFNRFAWMLCPTHNPNVRTVGPAVSAPQKFTDNDLPLLSRIINLREVYFGDSEVVETAAVEFQRKNPGCKVSHRALPKLPGN
jgi:hypothetical protein